MPAGDKLQTLYKWTTTYPIKARQLKSMANHVSVAVLERNIWDNYIQFLAEQTQPYPLPSGSLSLRCRYLGEMAKKDEQLF